jgi:protein-S-isoprenylcysteine O-methyltransferase Ste14
LKTTLGNLFFKWRSYTPIPLLLATLLLAQPTLGSITLGIMIALAGELTRIWAVAYAGGATRTLEPGVGNLITGGPFSYVRNPLYVGNLLLSLGVCLAAWPAKWSFAISDAVVIPWLLPIFVIAFAIQYGFIVAVEEDTIRRSLGEIYDEYYKAVPGWLPRLTPYSKRYPEKGNFKAGFRSDRRSIQTTSLVLLVIIIIYMIRLLKG